jgi:transposase
MNQINEVDALTERLERQFGVVLDANQIGEVVGVNSRTSFRRWLASAREEGLKTFEFSGSKAPRVLAKELAAWLIRKEGSRAGTR